MGYPGNLSLNVYQGETFTRTLTWSLDSVLVNVTGYTAALTVRPTPTGTEMASLTSGAGITLGGAAGTISFTFADNVTAAWTPGAYVWDLFLISGGGETTPLVAGSLIVRAAITHA